MSSEATPNPEPRTPIRALGVPLLISDPISSDSTLTSLSELSYARHQSSSPTRTWPLQTGLSLDLSTLNHKERRVEDPHTPRAINVRRAPVNGDGDSFRQLLSPQKALPATMKLVPDSSPRRLHFPSTSTAAGPSTSKHLDESDSSLSSDQEIWVKESDDELDWSEDEREELMETLREEGLVKCVEEYVYEKNYSLPKLLRAFGKKASANADPEELLDRLYSVMRQTLRNRKKIENYSTLNHAVQLLQNAKNIMLITGAGISVSCGIRDFRSKDGIYALIKNSGRYPDLEDPQQMFSYKEFIRRPSMFYSFIGQLWPQDVKPSLTHEFIRYLESEGKLLRNYTQNIDSLEVAAGVKRVFHCHGSFKTAKCMDCGREVQGSEVMDDVLACKIPQCPPCVLKAKQAEVSKSKVKPKAKPKKKKSKKGANPWGDDESEDDFPEGKKEDVVGVMKPSITFFGEKLHDSFDDQVYEDRDKVDLLLIIGSSLKVKPVSEISAHIPHSIPQILINREPIPHVNVDIALLGDCDLWINHLCLEAGWILPSHQETPRLSRKKRNAEEMAPAGVPQQLGNSHIWTFDGANMIKAKNYAQKFDPSLKEEKGSRGIASKIDPSLRENKRRRLS